MQPLINDKEGYLVTRTVSYYILFSMTTKYAQCGAVLIKVQIDTHAWYLFVWLMHYHVWKMTWMFVFQNIQHALPRLVDALEF